MYIYVCTNNYNIIFTFDIVLYNTWAFASGKCLTCEIGETTRMGGSVVILPYNYTTYKMYKFRHTKCI